MNKSDAIYVVGMVVGAILSIAWNSFIGFMITFMAFLFLLMNVLLTKRYKHKFVIIIAMIITILSILVQVAAQFGGAGN